MCRVPVGLPDVGHYPELFVALLDTGTWSLEDLSKLAGLNFLRVLKDVEKVNKLFNIQVQSLKVEFKMQNHRLSTQIHIRKDLYITFQNNGSPNRIKIGMASFLLKSMVSKTNFYI